MAEHLETVVNFRDVGKTVNDFLGERRVREGMFFRSARLDEATPKDREILTQDIAIKTVIDLRTKTEHLKQAKKHQASVPAGHVAPDTVAAQPFHIPGLTYREIKITGRPLERYLLRQLSWWSFIKFLFLFAFGYRMQSIAIISREVMIPRGLLGLGNVTLDQSGDEIKETLMLYTHAQDLPSVVHCTHGKDRTGLVCALVLMILDIPIQAIEHDYWLTDAALAPEREERLAEIREIGLTDDWAGTAKEMIVGIQRHLNEAYGGLDNYLDGIGFGKQERFKVRETLLY